MDQAEHTILCVDDEKNILNAMKRLLRKENYRLLTASNGSDALDLLAANDVHIVISDQRMPEMSGTDFLSRVKEDYPDAIRIILTGYTDVDTITESINKGHIYKFFLKPWNDHNLKLEIRQALEQYDLIKANRSLNRKVIQQNEELMAINENLESLVQERTRILEVQNGALQISHAILEELPLPIIGVSEDRMIVLVNRIAREIMGGDTAVEIGERIHAYFPNSLDKAISLALSTGQCQAIDDIALDAMNFRGNIIPLNGQFAGKGVILSMEKKGGEFKIIENEMVLQTCGAQENQQ